MGVGLGQDLCVCVCVFFFVATVSLAGIFFALPHC